MQGKQNSVLDSPHLSVPAAGQALPPSPLPPLEPGMENQRLNTATVCVRFWEHCSNTSEHFWRAMQIWR